jgi:hypothetical protein
LRLDLAEKWPERVTHSWVCWATVDQFWGDFVLVWFSSFLGDFVGGFCFDFLLFLNMTSSAEYGQWLEFGQLLVMLGNGRRGSMDSSICLEGWSGLRVVRLLEDVICYFSFSVFK